SLRSRRRARVRASCSTVRASSWTPSPPRSTPSPPATSAVGASAAGTARAPPPPADVRRWRASCEHLAVVRAAQDPGPVLARFAELPQIVALIEQDDRRALGVTVEGVPIELVTSAPERFGPALLRATGARAYVDALEPLPDAPDEATVYRQQTMTRC